MVVSDRKFFYVFDCIASNKRNASGCTRAVEVVLCSHGTCTSLESHKLRHNCPYFRFGNHHICISGITVHRGTWTLTLFDRPFSKIIHTVLGIFSMHPAFTSGKRRYRTAPILSHRWKAWHQKHGAASRNFVTYLAVKKTARDQTIYAFRPPSWWKINCG